MLSTLSSILWTGWHFAKRFLLPWNSDLPGVSRFFTAGDAASFHDGVVLLDFLKGNEGSLSSDFFSRSTADVFNKLGQIAHENITFENLHAMLQTIVDSSSALGKVKSLLNIVNFLYVIAATVTLVSGMIAVGEIVSWFIHLSAVQKVLNLVSSAFKAVYNFAARIGSFFGGHFRRMAVAVLTYGLGFIALIIIQLIKLLTPIVNKLLELYKMMHWSLQATTMDLPVLGMMYVAVKMHTGGEQHWSFLLALLSVLFHTGIWYGSMGSSFKYDTTNTEKKYALLSTICVGLVPFATLAYKFNSSTFAFFSVLHLSALIGLRFMFFYGGVAMGFDSGRTAYTAMMAGATMVVLGAADKIISFLCATYGVNVGPELLVIVDTLVKLLDIHRNMLVHFGAFTSCLATLIYSSHYCCNEMSSWTKRQLKTMALYATLMYIGWRADECSAAIGYSAVFFAVWVEEKLCFDIHWEKAHTPVFLGSAFLMACIFYGRKIAMEGWGVIVN